MEQTAFDAAAEVERLERIRKIKRKRPQYYRSRLDRYGAEMTALYRSGAKIVSITFWLRERKIKVHATTVARWLERHNVK